MARLARSFKYDVVFKMLFTKRQDLLKHLVAQLLCIPLQSINEFFIQGEEIPPETLGSKYCRLDINMMVNGRIVILEVQAEKEEAYPERALFNWTKVFASSLPSGRPYSELPTVIHINIMAFRLFPWAEYHSKAQVVEPDRRKLITDRMELHFFELSKIPKHVGADNSELELWLALFRANTEKDLAKLYALGVPFVQQAIGAYNNIISSEDFKYVERLREATKRDEAIALQKAVQEGREEERKKWEIAMAAKDALIAELMANR